MALPAAGFIGDAREQIDLLFLHDHAIGVNRSFGLVLEKKLTVVSTVALVVLQAPTIKPAAACTEGTGQVELRMMTSYRPLGLSRPQRRWIHTVLTFCTWPKGGGSLVITLGEKNRKA